MALHNHLGKEGEEAAVRFLEGKGYVIRHRNWRSGHKELDIVAVDGDTLVVAEVKTRRDTDYGTPETAVDNRKIRRIVSSTDAYLRCFEVDLPVRFNIVSVVGTEPPFHITHIEDAFLPPIW